MSRPDVGADPLIERDFKVDALRSHLLRGEEGLNDFPAALLRVIEEDAWRERVDWRTKERFTFNQFAEFVVAPPPAGLGADLGLIVRLVRGTPTERLLREAVKPGQGRKVVGEPTEVHRLTRGNSRAYWLARLHRDRPDLLVRVNAGALSAWAAAIEAGFVRPTVSIRTDSAQNAIRRLLRHFTADELRAALDEAESVKGSGPES